MTTYQVTVNPVVNAITVELDQPTVTVNSTVSTATGAAGGDLSGNYPNPTVDGLQGRAVSSTAPSNGQLLAWNGGTSQWEPTTPSGGTGTVTQVSSGTGLTGGPITTSGTLSVDFATSGSATAGKAVEATDSRLSDSRAPNGSAGGDLTGTYPNPTIANNAVTSAKILSGAVTTTKIATGAVGTTELADASVTQIKIGALAVTNSKIAAKAVTADKIADNTITTAQIAFVPQQTLLGRGSIGSGVIENIGLTADFGIDPSTYELYLTNRGGTSVVGRSASTAGAPADITATADGQVLRQAGGAIGFGSIPVSSVTGATSKAFAVAMAVAL